MIEVQTQENVRILSTDFQSKKALLKKKKMLVINETFRLTKLIFNCLRVLSWGGSLVTGVHIRARISNNTNFRSMQSLPN